MLRKIKSWWILSLIHTVLPVAVTFFLFILSYFYILLPALESNLMESKRQMIRELTHSVCHLLNQYELQYQKGELSLEEAQKRAKRRIRDIRYGPKDKDYFWISDTIPRMIMHPYRSDMEGKDLGSYTDIRGNDLFNDMVAAVRDSGSGYVDYFWQWMDSRNKIEPKISYVEAFKPWGWIVGTGIYTEDLDEQMARITNPLKNTYLIILLFMILLAVYMITQSGKIENQRIVALRQLSESEEKFKMIFNSLFNYIVLLDSDGKVIEMNQTGLELSGNLNNEIQGEYLKDINLWNVSKENQDILNNQILECKEKRLVRFQAQNKGADGHLVDMDVSLKAISDTLNEIKLIIVESRDITEQKQAEHEMKALIQALEEQKGELERFTYTVSHDLKSPLITIKGFLGLLASDIEKNDKDQMGLDFQRIHDAVNKMESLLKDLLELSRIGRIINVPEDIAVEDLVKDAQELAAGQLSEKNITIRVERPLPVVHGDGTRLREVMVNLISNAAKFMGDQKDPIIEIGAQRIENKQCLFVRDNGIGIKPEYRERIFGLFEKLNQNSSGTGIGLAIVKRIIEVHGGRIWVESEGPGTGSTFYFTLDTNQTVS